MIATAPPNSESYEQLKFCRDNLAWAEGVMRSNYGEAAVEFAEVALAEAVCTYEDSGFDTLQNWARRMLDLVWIRESRQLFGKTGTAKNKQIYASVPIDSLPEVPDRREPVTTTHQRAMEALRSIEAMDGKERWGFLCRYVGNYRKGDADQIAKRVRVRFTDLGKLLDGVMLFGAQIQRSSSSAARIHLERKGARIQVLPWVVAMIEQHGQTSFRMQLGLDEKDVPDRLMYRSTMSPLFVDSAHRWYREYGNARIPEGIAIDRNMLALWLVGTMTASRLSWRRSLRAPGMTPRIACDIMGQLGALGLNACDLRVEDHRSGARIVMNDQALEAARHFLLKIAPRCVWELKA